MQETVYRFGRFVLDTRAHALERDGVRIPVQEQPFQVLLALLEQPREVVSREALHRRLWGTNTFVDFDQSLNSAVRRLRVVLGDNSRRPVYVETIPRTGFRFLPTVEAEVLPAVSLQGAEKQQPNGHVPSIPALNGTGKASLAQTLRRFPLRGVAGGFVVMMLGLHGGHATSRLQRILNNHVRFKTRLLSTREHGAPATQH